MTRSTRILLTVLVACIGCMAFADSGYIYTQELDSAYISRSIYVCSDKSVVVLGNVDNYDELHMHTFVVTKLDPQGNLLWRRYPGYSGGFISIAGVDIDASDTVTFITTSISLDPVKLWMIDSNGVMSSISDSIYQPNQLITFNKALRTPDNKIVAVGKLTQGYSGSSACFFRFSATGDTLASAFWPVDQGTILRGAEAYDLALKDNGNTLITCMLHESFGSVLEITPEGNLLSRTNLPGNSTLGATTISPEQNLQSYIISYSYRTNANYNHRFCRYNEGTIDTLFSIDSALLRHVYSMKLGIDSIYVCGEKTNLGGVLLNLSYNGEVNWTWSQAGVNTSYYAGYGSASTALLDLDPNGCIYWAWGDSGSQVITKLLPNGQLPVEDDFAVPAVNRISAYPNPMKDKLSIKLAQDDGTNTDENRIEIYNIKGQLVRSVPISKGETQWDGKDNSGRNCPPGIYLLHTDKRSSQTRRICKTY